MWFRTQNSGDLANDASFFGDYYFVFDELMANISVLLRLHRRRHVLGEQGKFTMPITAFNYC
jgi:hypothetical protein